jgi:hypothetical protein
VTRLHHEAWSEELVGAPACFSEVMKGLQYDFSVGLEKFSLFATSCPANYMSSPEHESFLQMKYQKEIDLGRISPAYKHSHLKHIIGPFCTAPLSVVDSAGKLCVIVDHSFPDRNRPFDISSLPVDAAEKFVLGTSKTSINSVTDLENLKCDG